MAHWAEIDENNVVLRVVVGSNDDLDEGYQWIIDNLGGNWVKTSYNNNIRVRYAGVGYIYNEELDAFLPPKPYPSWIIDMETINWTAPVEKPKEKCAWSENLQQWIKKPDSGLWIWNFETEKWEEDSVIK